MRDYLEELMAGGGALLEELRRAERRLAGAAGTEGGAEPPSGEEPDGARHDREADAERREPDGRRQSREPDGRLNGGEDTAEYAPKKRTMAQEDREGRSAQKAQSGQRGMVPDRERAEADSPQALSRPYEQAEEGQKPAPLAARLERLDRAVLTPAGPDGRRRDGTRASGGDTVPLRRAALPGLAPGETDPSRSGGPASPGGETDWVEQTDRAFRRDSRRYDGGFYLY